VWKCIQCDVHDSVKILFQGNKMTVHLELLKIEEGRVENRSKIGQLSDSLQSIVKRLWKEPYPVKLCCTPFNSGRM